MTQKTQNTQPEHRHSREGRNLLVVSKVDQLMSLCDQMTIQIINSNQIQTKITDSLLMKLFRIKTKNKQKKEDKTDIKILTNLSDKK